MVRFSLCFDSYRLKTSLGIYSAIFWMYIQHQAELGIDKRNVVLYALCILYILSTATVVLNMTRFVILVSNISSCI
jgi:hypothetical protein